MSRKGDKRKKRENEIRAIAKSLGEPRGNGMRADANENSTTNEPRRNPPDGAFPSHYKPSPIYVECPKKEEKYSIRWWKTRIEIGGIIVSAIVLVVLTLQYREMVRTTNLDERAWLSVSRVEYVGYGTNWIFFRIYYQNTGKTLALNMESVIGMQTNVDAIPLKDIPPNPPANLGQLTPGVTSFYNTPTNTLEMRSAKAVYQGKVPFYLFGTIWYDDIFGINHWEQFCYRIIAGRQEGTFEIDGAPVHNSCDTN